MWATLCIEYNGITYRYKCNNHDAIYDRMMIITDNDHYLSEDVCNWAELMATIGDAYDAEVEGLSVWVEE